MRHYDAEPNSWAPVVRFSNIVINVVLYYENLCVHALQLITHGHIKCSWQHNRKCYNRWYYSLESRMASSLVLWITMKKGLNLLFDYFHQNTKNLNGPICQNLSLLRRCILQSNRGTGHLHDSTNRYYNMPKLTWVSIYLPLVPHICVSESDQHWFR